MNESYNKIMEMKGYSDFKKLISKWEKLSQNLTTLPPDLPIVLPDIILHAKSGSGVTHLLKALSEYLSTKESLMNFYGDVKFFEFSLTYCSESQPFGELERFDHAVRSAAGFRNEFRGIIRIDIDEWLGHHEEKYFIGFLEHLASNSHNWLIILTFAEADLNDMQAMESLIRAYMRVKKITIEMPEAKDFVEYTEETLAKYGLCVDESGKALLTETIEKLRGNKYFDGYKTIKMLCQDIIYEVLSKDGDFSKCITAEMMSAFSAESDYVKALTLNCEKVRKIGFSVGGTR